MGAPVFVRAGYRGLQTLKFLDPNNGNAAVTGKVYADLQNVVCGYFTSAGVRTTVTAASYLALTEEGGGEYRLVFTPGETLTDRWWFIHFVYPTGTQQFRYSSMVWVAKNKHVLQTGDIVFVDFFLNDPDGNAVTGKVKADFQAAELNVVSRAGTVTDKDSSLTVTEVGSGYYYASWTPSATVGSAEPGSWSYYLVQPTGTEEREMTGSMMVYDGTFANRVAELVADKAGSALQAYPNVLTNSISDAIVEYSALFPKRLYYALTGDGLTYEVAKSTLTGWVSLWSRVISIEYPAKSTVALNDTTYREPQFLDPSEWRWYDNGGTDATERLVLLGATPSSGEKAVISYTGLHDSDGTSINAGHLPFVNYLAAAWVLDTLANMSNQEGTGWGNDTAIDAGQRVGNWAAAAREYRARAMSLLRSMKPPRFTQVALTELE